MDNGIPDVILGYFRALVMCCFAQPGLIHILHRQLHQKKPRPRRLRKVCVRDEMLRSRRAFYRSVSGVRARTGGEFAVKSGDVLVHYVSLPINIASNHIASCGFIDDLHIKNLVGGDWNMNG